MAKGIIFAIIGSLRNTAPVAQLDRVPGFEPGGRGFESLRVCQMLVYGVAICVALLGFSGSLIISQNLPIRLLILSSGLETL